MQDLICEPEARLLSIWTTARKEILISAVQTACQNITSVILVMFGVEILLPLKPLCDNVYGAGAVKNDSCQELGKQQNMVQILLLTTGVGQRCLDGEEPAEGVISDDYRDNGVFVAVPFTSTSQKNFWLHQNMVTNVKTANFKNCHMQGSCKYGGDLKRFPHQPKRIPQSKLLGCLFGVGLKRAVRARSSSKWGAPQSHCNAPPS